MVRFNYQKAIELKNILRFSFVLLISLLPAKFGLLIIINEGLQ
jgi:hypothetical protein